MVVKLMHQRFFQISIFSIDFDLFVSLLSIFVSLFYYKFFVYFTPFKILTSYKRNYNSKNFKPSQTNLRSNEYLIEYRSIVDFPFQSYSKTVFVIYSLKEYLRHKFNHRCFYRVSINICFIDFCFIHFRTIFQDLLPAKLVIKDV